MACTRSASESSFDFVKELEPLVASDEAVTESASLDDVEAEAARIADELLQIRVQPADSELGETPILSDSLRFEEECGEEEEEGPSFEDQLRASQDQVEALEMIREDQHQTIAELEKKLKVAQSNLETLEEVSARRSAMELYPKFYILQRAETDGLKVSKHCGNYFLEITPGTPASRSRLPKNQILVGVNGGILRCDARTKDIMRAIKRRPIVSFMLVDGANHWLEHDEFIEHYDTVIKTVCPEIPIVIETLCAGPYRLLSMRDYNVSLFVEGLPFRRRLRNLLANKRFEYNPEQREITMWSELFGESTVERVLPMLEKGGIDETTLAVTDKGSLIYYVSKDDDCSIYRPCEKKPFITFTRVKRKTDFFLSLWNVIKLCVFCR